MALFWSKSPFLDPETPNTLPSSPKRLMNHSLRSPGLQVVKAHSGFGCHQVSTGWSFTIHAVSQGFPQWKTSPRTSNKKSDKYRKGWSLYQITKKRYKGSCIRSSYHLGLFRLSIVDRHHTQHHTLSREIYSYVLWSNVVKSLVKRVLKSPW